VVVDEAEDEAENDNIVLSLYLRVVNDERIPIKWIFHRSGPRTHSVCWSR
jgi:hypothetical protein